MSETIAGWIIVGLLITLMTFASLIAALIAAELGERWWRGLK